MFNQSARFETLRTEPPAFRPGGWTLWIFAWVAAFVFASCAKPQPPPETSRSTMTPPFRAVATVKVLMQTVVDPSADVIWDSVGTRMTKAATVERRPRTDEDWTRLRNAAVTLTESGNLLMLEPRAYDNDAWMGMSRALVEVGNEALKVVEAKDVDGVFAVGEKIDGACESCHVLYAYDNSPRRKK
jgi:hypothetical protein